MNVRKIPACTDFNEDFFSSADVLLVKFHQHGAIRFAALRAYRSLTAFSSEVALSFLVRSMCPGLCRNELQVCRIYRARSQNETLNGKDSLLLSQFEPRSYSFFIPSLSPNTCSYGWTEGVEYELLDKCNPKRKGNSASQPTLIQVMNKEILTIVFGISRPTASTSYLLFNHVPRAFAIYFPLTLWPMS